MACAAGSLDELAQMSAALVETSPQQHLVVQIGKGLLLPDTLQELRLEDGPQVKLQTLKSSLPEPPCWLLTTDLAFGFLQTSIQ